MGVVYRAQDTLLGRDVAVKTLRRLDAARLYQLKTEFRTLAGFSHPNLVQFYELAMVDDTWLLIMELIQGVELGRWVREGPSRERILKVFSGALEGLRVLHAAGHVHRDVKPANIMVTAEDRAVLLDFGLAVPIVQAPPGEVAGTAAYIAPEQLFNEPLGPPADWYSFGVALFEALTGELPSRPSGAPGSVPRGPKDLIPDLPESLNRTVERLLDVDPKKRPVVDELAKILGKTQSRGITPVLPATPFVARVTALKTLHELFQATSRGQTRIALVQGPSGIGKTALVRHFIKQLNSRSRHAPPLILEGRCHPRENVPFKALDALVDNLVRHLKGLDQQILLDLAPDYPQALLTLFPMFGRVAGVRQWPAGSIRQSPAELRRLGAIALRDLLAKLAARRRLLLWIDDLQWSDGDSALLLRELLSPPDAPNFLLLLSWREEPVTIATFLKTLDSEITTRIELAPLTTAEILELARATAPDAGVESSLDLESIARDSGGSPFFLNEWIRRRRELERDDSLLSMPTSVTELIRSRMSNLSEESRRLIEVISIAGRPLELDLALTASEMGGDGRLLANALCADSLLRVSIRNDTDYLETYHDRIRESVLAEIAVPVRRSLHRGLAEGIRKSRNPDSGELVEHYLAAEDRTEAARFVLPAAEEAERNFALDRAADMYERAMELRPDLHHDGWFLERRANAFANAAKRDEAAGAYERAAAATDAGTLDKRTALLGQAAEQFFCGGDLPNGLRALEQVLRDVDVRVPARYWMRFLQAQWFRVQFLGRGSRIVPRLRRPGDRVNVRLDALWRATRGVIMMDHTLADTLAGRHLLESIKSGDVSRTLRAIGLESAMEANLGGTWFWRRSRRLLETGELLAKQTNDPYDFAWMKHCRATCAWFEGRWRECVDLGLQATEMFRNQDLHHERAGASWDLAVQYGFILSALGQQGKVRELSRLLTELVADAKRRRDNYSLRVFQTGDAVLHWLAGNAPATALDEAERTLDGIPGNRFTSQHRHYLVAAVASHLYAGNPDKAWHCMAEAWRPMRAAGFLALRYMGTQLRYLRASSALALAQTEHSSSKFRRSLVQVANREERKIRGSGISIAVPLADAVSAAVAGALGQHERQISALRAAIAGFEAGDMRLHREAARLHLARLIPSSDDFQRESVEWMSSEGILDTDAMARALVPFCETKA